ncbi:MAG: hypothetical protein QNJ17_12745 [Desulfocapsaceae bacterium]|nr:hypothetical protein [Desulfocapsaceae bacterium]
MTESAEKQLSYSTDLLQSYPEVLDKSALQALEGMASLNSERLTLMKKRSDRRKQRFEEQKRIASVDLEG